MANVRRKKNNTHGQRRAAVRRRNRTPEERQKIVDGAFDELDAVAQPEHIGETQKYDIGALDPETVELTSIEIRAVQLRMAGMTFTEIANALGYSNRGGAHKAVSRALKKWGWNTVDEYRQIELQRLDALTTRYWPAAMGKAERRDENGEIIDPGTPPDPNAANMVMRLMERRARLLGLDAPQQIDLGMNVQEKTAGEEDVETYEKWLDLVSEQMPELEATGDDSDEEDEHVIDAEIVEDEQ